MSSIAGLGVMPGATNAQVVAPPQPTPPPFVSVQTYSASILPAQGHVIDLPGPISNWVERCRRQRLENPDAVPADCPPEG